MPTILPTALPADGHIRGLAARDLPDFRDHLLRLTPSSRRDRFNGYTDDSFLESYAARCFARGALVIGYVEGSRVRGAAELHGITEGKGVAAEIAFSVEDPLQHQGIGARLFERLIARALDLGYTSLHVTTHPQNGAMKALARKFGARLCFQTHEAVGVIDLKAFRQAAPAPAEPKPDGRPMPRSPLMAVAGMAGTLTGAGRAALGFWAPGMIGK